MFQILANANFNFMGRRRAYLVFSTIVVLVCLAMLIGKPLTGRPFVNLGIEFSGGTEMLLRYADTPDLGSIRSALKEAGLGSPVVTTIGDESDHEVYIRISERGDAEDGKPGGDISKKVFEALRSDTSQQMRRSGRINLNESDRDAIRDVLFGAPDLDPAQAEALADRIAEMRLEDAIIRDLSDLQGIDGMTPQVMSFLESRTYAGEFVLRSQSYIGPAVGERLLKTAAWAILLSLAGVLAYIGLRFEFRWGAAAIAALTHDTIVTLALFSISGYEMSIPVVAAFLTLIGYSVNDTVVVFDRIRENLKTRGTQRLDEVVNRSINQTLSRTVITSGLTWIVVFGLYVFGGEALRAFSFVLTIGVVVGTYSSICIASPILVLWREATLRRKGIPVPGADPGPRTKPKTKPKTKPRSASTPAS